MSKSIAILGGGISGLSAAYYLLNKSIQQIGKIYILEQQSRVGGWLQSKSIDNGNSNGQHFEIGPRTISLNSYAGINVLSLANSIGLADKIKSIPKKSKSFQRRYVVIDGKLRLLPSSLTDLFIRRSPFKPMIYYLLNDLRQPPVKLDPITDDISVNDFFHQRFGEDIARYLINPLCIGITGGDSRQLSIRSVFPAMFQDEQLNGSIVKSMFKKKKQHLHGDLRKDLLVMKSIEEKWAVFSFHNGIETLPKYLLKFLRDNYSTKIHLMLNTRVNELVFTDNNCLIRINNKNDEIKVDHCFSSIPARHLSSILESDQQKLKEILSSIKTVHMAVVCLQFDKQIIPKDMGFGFLVPSIENSQILGCTFDSCMFTEDENHTKMTVMLGGYRFDQLFGNDPDSVDRNHLINVSLQALKKYLSIDQQPINVHVAIHRDCIPQYTVGHHKRLKKIEQQIADLPLSLLGSSYYGFSVPDTILNARREAEKWLNLN